MDPILRRLISPRSVASALVPAEDPSGPPLEIPELEELPDPRVGTATASTGRQSTGANPNPITGIDVAPGALTLNAPAAARWSLNARASYQNGTTRDVTELASWSSSAPSVATVDASGVVTAHAPGSALVRATLDGVSGVSEVTIITATTDAAPAPATTIGAVPWWGWAAAAAIVAGGVALAVASRKKGRN